MAYDIQPNFTVLQNKKQKIVTPFKNKIHKYFKKTKNPYNCRKSNIDITLKKMCTRIFREKCKFIFSNCVIVASFQIEFNKYKYLQKLNILETKKTYPKKNYLWHMMSIQISQNCKTKNKIVTSFKNQMFYQNNILRKCKFICSNCVIVTCFQI